MKIQGTIEAKSLAKAKNKASYATFTIDGKNYNTFDEELIDNFQIGDVVEIETKTSKDGRYENMISMRNLDVAPETVKVSNGKEFHKTIESCRSEALGHAIALHAGMGLNSRESIMKLAVTFFNYIWNGDDGKEM